MELTRDNVLWFAGLFEGEGYFRFRPKGRRSMGIAIKMTDRDVLEKALEKFGGWVWDGQQIREPHHKQAYQWHLDKRDRAYALLVAIYPFLGARRQAQVEKWVEQYKQLAHCPHGIPGYAGGRSRDCDVCLAARSDKMRKAWQTRKLNQAQPAHL